MLMWGNAFVFNKKMIAAMREQWKSLGAIEGGKSVAVGCPQFMRGRQDSMLPLRSLEADGSKVYSSLRAFVTLRHMFDMVYMLPRAYLTPILDASYGLFLQK